MLSEVFTVFQRRSSGESKFFTNAFCGENVAFFMVSVEAAWQSGNEMFLSFLVRMVISGDLKWEPGLQKNTLRIFFFFKTSSINNSVQQSPKM